jgi:hypothetical protein
VVTEGVFVNFRYLSGAPLFKLTDVRIAASASVADKSKLSIFGALTKFAYLAFTSPRPSQPVI